MLIRIVIEPGFGFQQILEADAMGKTGRRVLLNVPYAEKDEAKRLGARWDTALKTWYIPERMDAGPFWRWITTPDETRVRSSSYSVAQAETTCWRCRKKTDVLGLFVPTDFEYRAHEDRGPRWRRSQLPTIVSYVTDLLPTVANHVTGISKNFHVDHSETRQQTYWMNHCSVCDARLGDFGLHRDPNGPFFAAHQPGASTVSVMRTFMKPFECKGDVSFGGDDMFYVSLEERHYS